MIKLQVIGNLGKDCIVNAVNAKNVINFSVAHTEKYKDAQGVQKEKTTWVECAYWAERTAIAPYLRKGTMVYVEGTPEVRQYTKNDGTSGATLSLRVISVQLLGQKQEGSNQAGIPNNGNDYNNQQLGQTQNNYNLAPTASEVTEPIDDLPF